MLRLLIGRAGSGKTARIFSEIKNNIENGKSGIVLIVPDQYSHDAERQLCRLCGDSSNGNAEVLSFSRLCSRVFSELGGAADKFIDEPGRILLMARALDLAATRLKTFSGKTKKSEFITRLSESSRELKSARISVEDLLKTAENARPALRDKLEDTALILDIFNSFLVNDVKNPDDKLDRLCKLLPESIVGNGGVYIDGFYDFTAQQTEVISRLLKSGKDVAVCITCDTSLSDEPVFHMSLQTISRLCDIAAKSSVKCVIERIETKAAGKSAELVHIEKNLFSVVKEKYDGSCENIRLYKCGNVIEECENTAARILDRVRNGERWRDIAVACGNIEKYSAVLKSVFDKYGIPLYLNRKTDVMKLPPCLALCSALRLINSGWDYENMFSYLKTGFAGISEDETNILENYCITWDIRGKLWYSASPWKESSAGYNTDPDENELKMLNELRQRISAPLVKLQKAMRSALNADRVKALFDFCEDIALFENIESMAEKLSLDGNVNEAETLMRFGDILTDAMEQFYSIAGDINTTLDEFIYQWELILSCYDLGTIPPDVDSVAAGDISRLKKRDIKHLYILGATEDDVPKHTSSGGIFSDSERDELILLKLGLSASADERLFGDLTSLYESVTMPSSSLTLSYSENTSDGSTAAPAEIFAGIASIFDMIPTVPSVSDYKTAAIAPCIEFSAIYGKTLPEALKLTELFKDDAHYNSLVYAYNDVSQKRKAGLTPERAKKLFGERISLTASRVDSYKSCRYSYFLKYGLKAKPRKRAEFDAATIGSFMHYLLENVVKEIEANGGFKTVTDEECDAVTKKYVDKYIADELDFMQEKTARFVYLFGLLTEDARMIVRNMADELRNSKFKPYDFELEFSNSGEMPPYMIKNDSVELSVHGKVDRVDGWVHDDKLYLRVVDYKTGVKSFDLSDVWYGVGMQMLIYLFALKAGGKRRYNMEIVPAGVVYAPAKEVIVSGTRHMSDKEILTERKKKIKYSGLILNSDEVIDAMCDDLTAPYIPVKLLKDGSVDEDCLASAEQLGALGKHIDNVLCQISAELENGEISADPYFISARDTACTYCDYYNACLFGSDGKEKPKRRTALKVPEVWTRIGKECGSGKL